MKSLKFGLALAAREHLASGEPITRLEALVLYGVSNLPDIIRQMRQQGWAIKSRLVPFTTAMVRVNRSAGLQPPPNLPVRQIQLTEYWVGR
jgi:hypothetical protein